MVPFFKGDTYRQKYELIGIGGNTSPNTIEKFLKDRIGKYRTHHVDNFKDFLLCRVV